MTKNIAESRVDIAMATYNGARYIGEQLASIDRQTFDRVNVYISDDRSSDDTVASVRDCQVVSLVHVNEINLGPAQNFWKALSLCKADYIALSDQDDTWEPRKIEILLQRMMKVEHDKGTAEPVLVYSDLAIVDKDLKPISSSFFRTTRKKSGCLDARDFIVSNHIPGCTMLINRALLDKAGQLPSDVRMHDWWLALIASLSGTLSYVDEPLINYRQHENNAVGAPPKKALFSLKSISGFLRSAIKRAKMSNSIVGRIRAMHAANELVQADLPHWVKRGFRLRDRIYIAFNPKSGERRALSIAVACMIK